MITVFDPSKKYFKFYKTAMGELGPIIDDINMAVEQREAVWLCMTYRKRHSVFRLQICLLNKRRDRNLFTDALTCSNGCDHKWGICSSLETDFLKDRPIYVSHQTRLRQAYVRARPPSRGSKLLCSFFHDDYRVRVNTDRDWDRTSQSRASTSYLKDSFSNPA